MNNTNRTLITLFVSSLTTTAAYACQPREADLQGQRSAKISNNLTTQQQKNNPSKYPNSKHPIHTIKYAKNRE